MELEINRQIVKALTENYQYELVHFESKNLDKNEIDFLKLKVDKYKDLVKNHLKYLNFSNTDFLNLYKTENAEQVKRSLTEHTSQELDNLITEIHLERFKSQITTPFRNGNSYVWFYESKLNKLLLANTNQSQQNEIAHDTDLSNTNAVQKIIYLNELGIIDLLKKQPCFAASVNNLATLISAITGEKQTTIQPYLNVLINRTGNENNNPYKTTKTVEKVKNQLILLGFPLK
jgi:hypothetical protein